VKKYPEPFKHFYLAMQISGTLQCPVIALVAGLWLDGKYGTTPRLMFGLMFVALFFAIYSIYRTVRDEQKKLSKQKLNRSKD
jgi:F0F1-type ATP synthase assembly protein I